MAEQVPGELAAPAPRGHLLSSMAVYTAWGDTEKNPSSRSSQVSSVSCGRDQPRGQAVQAPHAWGSLLNQSPGLIRPGTCYMRLLNCLQGCQALSISIPLNARTFCQ